MFTLNAKPFLKKIGLLIAAFALCVGVVILRFILWGGK